MADKDTAELVQAARDFAAQNTDLYALLEVPLTETKDKIHRAWRRQTLKYHPDKTGDAFDEAKYELFSRARAVLVEPVSRQAYDTARSAALLRQAEREKLQGARRQMMDDLEAREMEHKRRQDEEREKSRELEREKARLAEEGRRRMEVEEREFREAQRSAAAKQMADGNDDPLAQRERDLEQQIEERRRRKVERKAEKKARKSGVPLAASTATATATATPDQDHPELFSRTGGRQADDLKESQHLRNADAVPTEGTTSTIAIPWPELKAEMIATQRERDAKNRRKAELLPEAPPKEELGVPSWKKYCPPGSSVPQFPSFRSTPK
jgi:DnaJ homolog subfamily C member 17